MPDPAATPPQERRHSVRQKLHSPVYASFNGPGTGMVVDLSELIDLNEEGFAVQTGAKLEINRAVTLSLELPETKSYIHGSGQVIWSDDVGRSGVRFAALPDNSRRLLKEWLLANLLIGSSNHAARSEQLARHQKPAEPVSRPVVAPEPEPAKPADAAAVVQPSADHVLAQVQEEFDTLSALDAVPEELRSFGTDTDAIFAFITDHALHLTGASGAALAFLTDGKLICRGRAGEISPPLAAPVDARQGLTGECFRTASLVSCEDTGNDPRVDPEVPRALGIGSLLAAPIKWESSAVGLIEVFFSQPRHFSRAQKDILLRLVDMIPPACLRQSSILTDRIADRPTAIQKEAAPKPATSQAPVERIAKPKSREQIVLEQAAARRAAVVPRGAAAEPSPFLFRALIGLTIVIVAIVVGYLVGPWVEKRISGPTKDSQGFLNAAEASSPARVKQVKKLADLRQLAEKGDSDAQWQLGVRYHNGEEVARDDTRAMLWFLRAAEQGQVTAQATLGAYYWAGRGVPQDLSRAYFWSTLALAQGDENSRSRLEGLASQMTKAQVAAARQQAEIWLNNHNAQTKSAAD